MAKTIDERELEIKKSPTLKVDRPLMPIADYAKREGVPIKVIEECGRIGIAQIRKYKGKTYVVDVPLGDYAARQEQEREASESQEKVSFCGRSSRFWQNVAFVALAGFLISLAGNMWLYVNNYEPPVYNPVVSDFQRLEGEFAQMNQLSQAMGRELAAFAVELEFFQNQIALTKLEVESIQGELTLASEELKAVSSDLAIAGEEIGQISEQLTPSRQSVRDVQDRVIKARETLRVIEQRNSRTALKLAEHGKKLSGRINQLSDGQ